MAHLVAILLPYRLFVAGVTLLAIIVPVATMTKPEGDPGQSAVVTRIVDGDTIEVDYDQRVHKIRLLNVDTPETKDPHQPVRCLGPEATTFLRDQLPQGTSVRLRFDQERNDRYGRELAGVFLKGRLVNADIARAGLGLAVLFEPNARFYAEVRNAQQEAEEHQIGLFSPDIPCTIPAMVSRLEQGADALTRSEPQPGATAETLDLQATRVATALTLSRTVSTLARRSLSGAPYPRELQRQWSQRLSASAVSIQRSAQQVTRVREQEAARARAAHKARAAARAKAQQAAQRSAERAARQAKKRSQAAATKRAHAKARAAQRAAVRKATHAAHRRAAREARAPKAQERVRRHGSRTMGHRSRSSPRRSGKHDGYTGCRAYGKHGTSIDSKGRRYTKIHC